MPPADPLEAVRALVLASQCSYEDVWVAQPSPCDCETCAAIRALPLLERALEERDALQAQYRFGTPFDPTGAKTGTEIQSLRAQLAASRERERGLREALAGLVKINEEHNLAVSEVIGRPIGWKDTYLDAARAALSPEKETDRAE